MRQDKKPSISDSVQSALADSLVHGDFTDVKFFLFTRRFRSGQVGKPLPLYANSAVLNAASPYFSGLLSGGFRESRGTKRDDEFPANQSPISDTYGYDSDSDLGDDDDDKLDISHDARQELPNKKCPVNESDQTSVPSTSETVQEPDGNSICTIVIRDTAFMTWQSLVFYLYTGQLNFAPLKSQGARFLATETELPLCSPKSMYRLADKLGLDELKEHALEDIRSKLSTDNVLDELFSQFTSRYPDVMEVETAFLRKIRVSSDVMPLLQQKCEAIAGGYLPHAAGALMSVFEIRLADEQSTLTKEPTSPSDISLGVPVVEPASPFRISRRGRGSRHTVRGGYS
ncbi:hypothetical protein AcV5_008151 [Taiwanofungus camphoratus]|nr:hypothetical protein AcV5_008151 [Antrodia cinnamomea]